MLVEPKSNWVLAFHLTQLKPRASPKMGSLPSKTWDAHRTGVSSFLFYKYWGRLDRNQFFCVPWIWGQENDKMGVLLAGCMLLKGPARSIDVGAPSHRSFEVERDTAFLYFRKTPVPSHRENPAPLVGGLSQYLLGFIHANWCRILFIHSSPRCLVSPKGTNRSILFPVPLFSTRFC